VKRFKTSLPFLVLILFVSWNGIDATLLSQTKKKTKKQPSQVRTRSQEEQLRRLTDRVDTMEAQLNQLMGIIIPDVENALSTVVRSKAQSDSVTILLINRINTLQNKMKILEDKATYADSTNLEMLEQLLMIENKIVTLTRSFNELYALRAGKTESGSETISSDKFKRNYIEALSRYQNGDFQEAIDGFTKLIKTNPEHKLADNSQYWLGECYYTLKNYKRAIIEFEKIFNFSNKDKWDDAQLKLGLCHLKINNMEKARDEFQKLLDHYPGSEYYQKAQQYLRQL